MNVFNASVVEAELKALIIASGATETVYPNRPKSAPTKNDFAVARVTGAIEDMHTYGECVVEITLFAKDTANVKNSAKLTYMYERLVEGFYLETDDLIFESTPTILADVADDYGYHARILNVKTILKVTN